MSITKTKNDRGFTLIELMITLLISMVVIGSIYTAFLSQQHAYIVQDQVVEMQQNIRAGLMMMVQEIRMAGYDSTGKANAGIIEALNSRIGFTQDLDEDSNVSTSETVTFKLNGDSDGDGVVDNGGVSTIGRRTGSGVFQPIAENIQAIEFYYTLADGSQTISPSNPNDIRSVQISILARAGKPDREFTNTTLYCPASHPIKNLTTSPPQCEDSSGATVTSATWGPYNDNFRRRLLITTVRCRNMGL